jgi:hypothetical protein
VAARILRSKLEIRIEFLSGFHFHIDRLSLFSQDAPGIGVQNESGVDQIAVILQKPIDAIEGPSLFVGG